MKRNAKIIAAAIDDCRNRPVQFCIDRFPRFGLLGTWGLVYQAYRGHAAGFFRGERSAATLSTPQAAWPTSAGELLVATIGGRLAGPSSPKIGGFSLGKFDGHARPQDTIMGTDA